MHHHDEQFESRLGPELMSGFASDPLVPASIEDNLVGALHERGVLRGGSVSRGHNSNRRGLRRFVLPLSMAASIVFAFVAGAWFGAANAGEGASNVLAARGAGSSSALVAQRVGLTALDYLDALGSIEPSDSASARVAILSVRAAGDEIVRLAPESELAQAMRMVSLGLLRVDPANAAALASHTRLVWY
jgi:hypothetical protein